MLLIFKHILERNDIGVRNRRQNFNLTRQLPPAHISFLHALDRYKLVRLFVLPAPHNCMHACAELRS